MKINLKKRNLISSKKGIVIDMIFFVIVLFVVASVVFFGWKIFTDVNADLQGEFTMNESLEALNEVDTRYPSVFDGLIILIMLGFWVAGIVTALISDQHPLMFGFMMIVIVFVLISAAFISNYFEETYQDAELSDITTSFPKANWIMTHLMEITLVVVLSIVLALLGKNRA